MAIVTDLGADIFYIGADWPNIPMQLTPVGDLTDVPMAFYVFPLLAKSTDTPLITEKTTGGGIVITGPNTNITTGLFYVKVPAADSLALSAEVGQIVPYRWELWRTDGGNKNMMGRGTIPVMG